MKVFRYISTGQFTRVGLMLNASEAVDLSSGGVRDLTDLLEDPNLTARAQELAGKDLPRFNPGGVQMLAPVERQEVWAAGVTYQRSKSARMDESEFSASAYDRVYDAERPELFFKATAEKVVGPGDPIGVRQDSKWTVPEPELALVLNSRGELVGYTVGNDVSARDIEGENLLYLPQAKIYAGSCALGPAIEIGADEQVARSWQIRLAVGRGNRFVFTGETEVSRIKRSFAGLAEFLFRSQRFPSGVVLLTGTGIVPPDDFTLRAHDVVSIEISGIGRLENPVVKV